MPIAQGKYVKVVPLSLSVFRELAGETEIVKGTVQLNEISMPSGEIVTLLGLDTDVTSPGPFAYCVFDHRELFGSSAHPNMLAEVHITLTENGLFQLEPHMVTSGHMKPARVSPIPEDVPSWTAQPPIRDPAFVTMVVQSGKDYARSLSINAFPFQFMIELAPGLVVVSHTVWTEDAVRIYLDPRRYSKGGTRCNGPTSDDGDLIHHQMKMDFLDMATDPQRVHQLVMAELGYSTGTRTDLSCDPIYEVWERRNDLST